MYLTDEATEMYRMEWRRDSNLRSALLALGILAQVPLLLALPAFDRTMFDDSVFAAAGSVTFFAALIYVLGPADYYRNQWQRPECRSARIEGIKAVTIAIGCEAVMVFGTAWAGAGS